MTNPPTPQGVTLREALEPFAKLFQSLQSKHDGPMPTTFEAIISTEDVRRAAYAFSDSSHPPAPEQASVEETAWCIEQNLSPIPPEWFIGGPINSVEFSSDPNKAMRFSRRKDAQAMLDWFRCNNKLLVCDPNVEHFYKVTEHKWLSASPAAPEAAKPTTENRYLNVTLTKDEAEYISAFIADESDKDDEVVQLVVGSGHSGFGLYGWHPEYQEEGSILIKSLPVPEPLKAADAFELHRLLSEERETVRQLNRALREATEAPTFMGDPVWAAKPEQQVQAGEPEVAGSNALGCDKEAAGGTLCADWCGSSKCPISNTPPEVGSSTEAYKAYANNLPGAHDHLTADARKRLEESANFCLSPRPNFEPKRSRSSDDGYYEHAEASRLWWAFAAGMNYEEKRNREAMAELESSYRMWWRIAKNLGEDCANKDAALKAVVEAGERAKAALSEAIMVAPLTHLPPSAGAAIQGLDTAITQMQGALK